jgi:hypothetical protein
MEFGAMEVLVQHLQVLDQVAAGRRYLVGIYLDENVYLQGCLIPVGYKEKRSCLKSCSRKKKKCSVATRLTEPYQDEQKSSKEHKGFVMARSWSYCHV